MKTSELFTFNGIDGLTGEPLFPAMNPEELGRLALGDASGEPRLRHLRAWTRRRRPRAMGPKEGVDPRRLEEAGWGVVFAEDTPAATRRALEPLLAHRRRQAGRLAAGRYREFAGRDGYRRGESKQRFLARHGAGPGPADPDRVPYYLLLVGDPGALPYSIQTQLGVQYAVGRLCFDTPEEYAAYAEAVVAAESGAFTRPRRLVFFGPRDEGDRATELTHDELLLPLAHQMEREARGWEVLTATGTGATRDRLGRLLGGGETPAVLFAGTHGVGISPPGHPRQRAEQGALVCQRGNHRQAAPAPEGDGSPPCFTAADVGENSCPGGLIAFAFACFSAGTPRRNDFAHRGAHEPAEVSDHPFVARLPQRLLGHPRGGALAVVGHVDRAWNYSFSWPRAGRQTEVFASTLRRLLAGHPVGSAMEFIHQRYAELECDLAELRARIELGGAPDLLEAGRLWTARNDARNFLVLGDPAARLTPGEPA